MKIIVIDINGTPHETEKGTKPDFDIFAQWSGHRYLAMASNGGDLFDPMNVSLNINERDRMRGNKFWRLRTCSKECYEQYVVFLRSKNRTPYILAQRRFRNDFR